MSIRLQRLAVAVIASVLLSAAHAGPAAAQDRLCDPGAEDCRSILINYIRAETVGIDVAFWFMEDARYTTELINRFRAGVPVRVLVDSRANATNLYNADRLLELKNAGIPMRERYTGGILHWKMMLFAGQGVVEFSGANYSADAWLPSPGTPPYTNYIDEAIYFTGAPAIVDSFRTKYDDLWMSDNPYRNYANVPATRTRAYGTFPKDPQLNFVPAESYPNRAVGRYNRETQQIDAIMYRITDRRHTDAVIAAKQRGVRVRLITEPQQYRDIKRLWHSWNVDRLYMAGVEVMHRKHAGLNHQKSVLLYGLGTTIFGSSNWSSPSGESQEEHNMFSLDPATFDWFRAQFERKWTGSAGVVENEPFVPLPPDRATTPSPAAAATGVPASGPVTLQWYGGPWAHLYDVYLGTDSANLPLVAADLALGPSEKTTQMQTYVVSGPLIPGTTYYWKIVSKTMALQTRTSSTWSFTTDGVAPPPPTATLVREPYLQQVSATGAVIAWATRESGPAEVRYGLPGAPRTVAAAQSTLFSAATTGLADDYHQHVATISGLAPATAYEYDILVSGIDLNTVTDTFRTAPAPGTGSVTFVALGDSGTGSAAQQQIASLLAGDTFDLALHTGDVAYGVAEGIGAATFQTTHDWFFTPYSSWLRARPVFPSMGNHDSRAENDNGRPYLGLFVLPANGASAAWPDHAERYYSFDYGPAHIVAIDTELAFLDPSRQAAQLAWLEADLAATSQPWKIAVLHRAPYSSGGGNGSSLDVRAALAPVFERYGVQLVLSGHEHDYERTVPLKADAPDPAGVTYVVTGGGGAPLYPNGTSSFTAASASRHHYVRGTVTECTLDLGAVGDTGTVFDSVTLVRCTPPPDTTPPSAAVSAPSAGTSVRAMVSVAATASDNVGVVDTELIVDGVPVLRDATAPYGYLWDSTTVANGTHTLEVRATDAAGNAGLSASVSVTVANPVAGAGDIVLYAGDAPAASIFGRWQREADATAAGGAKLRNPNAGASKRTTALAAPADYFELTFNAPADVPYHLWVRGRADADSYANDSVFVQFSDTAVYGIGTTSAAEVNLEECSGCRVSGWGWQDNGYGANVLGPNITFTTSGPHTLRVQVREDGLAIDQIVLSPATFLSQAPGAVKNDATIYARNSGSSAPADTGSPAAALVAPAEGAVLTGTVAASVEASDNVGVTQVELLVDGVAVAVSASGASPYALSWDSRTAANGPHVLTARVSDAAGNRTVSSAVNVTVDNPPAPDTTSPAVSITAPAAGSSVAGTTTVTVAATDNVGVTQVELFVDGVSAGIATAGPSPYSFAWDTTSLPDGSHTLQARAVDAAGNAGTSAGVAVNVANTAPPPPSQIVIYAADVPATSIVGRWQRETDATAAGGARLRNPNANAAKRTVALAAPADYFEVTFTAQANVPYHLWIRSRADADYYANDSVFVQFSSVAGALIGTTGAAEMNLEDCSGCRISGWGWQDNGYNGLGPDIVFTQDGTQTIRIQPREDGLAIDQIVLSPLANRTVSPGALKNDNTIVPK